MNGIEFQNVSKRYGADSKAPLVVQDVSFAVPKGTLTTILGPSGCGKTTTLRMIAGLELPSAGRILIDGVDVTPLGPAQRNVSLVFQNYALFPHMDVMGNVCYGLRMSGVPTAQARDKAMHVLDTVGLKGLDARMPGELSGGQQQRVALARALALEPAVLLFDEPLSNLDARLRRNMREEIRALQQRLKLTVAYVTHDQSEALAVSDTIIVMDKGVVAQQGSSADLYESPRSEFVAGFMGEAMLFEAAVDSQGAVSLGTLRVPGAQAAPGTRVKVAVRPEAWRVGPTGVPGLAGIVQKRAYLGSLMEYTIITDLGAIFVTSLDVRHALSVDAPVTLSLMDHGVSVVSV